MITDDEYDDDRVAETAAAYGSRYITVEEYLELEAASPFRHEYVDGVMYAMSGALVRHNVIGGNVFAALLAHLRGKPCRPYIEAVKAAYLTSRKNFFYYPDVMVACGKTDLEAQYIEDPKLVIEVLSPSTEKVDRKEKALNYQKIVTLEEYVLIAQSHCEVTVQRRRGDWRPEVLNAGALTVELESVGLKLPLMQIYEGLSLDA